MIQRIQSLLLLGAAILLTLVLLMPIYSNSSLDSSAHVVLEAFSISYTSAPEQSTAQQDTPSSAYIGALALLAAITSLFIIFQFKNRSLQMRLCGLNILLISALIGSYFLGIRSANELLGQPGDGSYQTGFFLPIGALILTFLANRYIKKDEKLVRSIDRLR